VENTPDLAIEHQNVPTNHQGLHDFLYSATDEHAVTATQTQLNLDGGDRQRQVFNQRILSLVDWQSLAENARVAGVYAVLDGMHQTQCLNLAQGASCRTW
jgi:hypothetical protein